MASQNGRRPDSPPRLFVITHASQGEQNQLWKDACQRQVTDYVEVVAETTDYIELDGMLRPADMVYRSAATIPAIRLEQWLVAKGACSHHPAVDRVFFNCVNPALLLEANGLPTIPAVYDLVHDRNVINRYAELLGGLPLVVKVLGGYQGQGVVRVDSLPALYALADFVLFGGLHAYLMAYVPHVRFRVVVLGGRVVAASRHVSPDDDFRAAIDVGVAVSDLPEEMRLLALRATTVMQTSFAGVDLLSDTRSETLFLSAVNTPFQFAPTQAITQVDIAGQSLDFLLQKRRH